MTRIQDQRVLTLAKLLGESPVAALGTRSMLFEFVLDVWQKPDLTDVPLSQWALLYSIPKADVPALLEAFEDAGFVRSEGGNLYFEGWDEAKGDEMHSSFRKWVRSKPGALARLSTAMANGKDS